MVWHATAITGHQGNDITVTCKTKLLDYYGNHDRSGSEWGTFQVYYKNGSVPTSGSPGTQIGSDITSLTALFVTGKSLLSTSEL